MMKDGSATRWYKSEDAPDGLDNGVEVFSIYCLRIFIISEKLFSKNNLRFWSEAPSKMLSQTLNPISLLHPRCFFRIDDPILSIPKTPWGSFMPRGAVTAKSLTRNTTLEIL